MTNEPEQQEARQTDRAGQAPNPHDLGWAFRRFAKHAIVIGVLASLFFHFGAFEVARRWIFVQKAGGQSVGGETVVDFAVMTEA